MKNVLEYSYWIELFDITQNHTKEWRFTYILDTSVWKKFLKIYTNKSIEVLVRELATYKSIEEISWVNVPKVFDAKDGALYLNIEENSYWVLYEYIEWMMPSWNIDDWKTLWVAASVLHTSTIPNSTVSSFDFDSSLAEVIDIVIKNDLLDDRIANLLECISTSKLSKSLIHTDLWRHNSIRSSDDRLLYMIDRDDVWIWYIVVDLWVVFYGTFKDSDLWRNWFETFMNTYLKTTSLSTYEISIIPLVWLFFAVLYYSYWEIKRSLEKVNMILNYIEKKSKLSIFIRNLS